MNEEQRRQHVIERGIIVDDQRQRIRIAAADKPGAAIEGQLREPGVVLGIEGSHVQFAGRGYSRRIEKDAAKDDIHDGYRGRESNCREHL